MTMLISFWPVVVSAVLAVVWIVRIESKVKEHDREIQNIQEAQEKSIDKLNSKLDRVDEKIEALGKEISELTGYLKRCQEEK